MFESVTGVDSGVHMQSQREKVSNLYHAESDSTKPHNYFQGCQSKTGSMYSSL